MYLIKRMNTINQLIKKAIKEGSDIMLVGPKTTSRSMFVEILKPTVSTE